MIVGRVRLSGLTVIRGTIQGTKMTSQLINPKVIECDVSVHTNSVLVRLQSADSVREVFGLRFTDGLKMAKFCGELVAEVMKQMKAEEAKSNGKEADTVAGA